MAQSAPEDVILIPQPRKVVWGEHPVPAIPLEIHIPAEAPKAVRHGAAFLATDVKEAGGGDVPVVEGEKPGAAKQGVRVTVSPSADEGLKPEGYRLTMAREGDVTTVAIEGRDVRGMLNGLLTLRQLLVRRGKTLCFAEAKIEDWPSYAVRDFCRDGYDAVADVRALAEWAAPFKIDVIGVSHFWPWRNVPEEYWKNARSLGAAARETGAFEVMFYCNPYTGYHKEKQIDLLNDAEMNHFLRHIRTGIEAGATKVMICVDDFTVWDKFSAEEKKRFKDLAHAQAFLMNHIYREIRKEHPAVEFYFCPAGPKGGYAGVPTKGSIQEQTLRVLAEEIPEDVGIVWTGPEVRSRTISSKQIEAWSAAAKGRKPFLWDNTIYAHYQPLFVETFLNPFRNEFPADLPQRLHRGIHINGPAGGSEIKKISMLTAADYLWNAEGYDPKASLARAMTVVAGKASVPLMERFRDEAVAAIRVFKKDGKSGVEEGRKAAKTLEELKGATANAALVDELRGFLRRNLSTKEGSDDVFKQIFPQ